MPRSPGMIKPFCTLTSLYVKLNRYTALSYRNRATPPMLPCPQPSLWLGF
ncbi:MAG: hypothetical protein OXK72_04640 [Gammaproteobacteria bacterium]|nr:hypothetical protein [Gammaproteobacteria bacterium]MDE0410911.1 hypothetical protein [Gammaproteobacteria bacterium]